MCKFWNLKNARCSRLDVACLRTTPISVPIVPTFALCKDRRPGKRDVGSAMKQSVLSFAARPSQPSTSQAHQASIVIDSDEDDGIKTPPPPVLRKAAKAKKSSAKQASSIDEPVQRMSLGPSDDNTTKAAIPSAAMETVKKPHSDHLPDTLPIDSPSDLSKNVAKSRKGASGEGSILCHQHRAPCTPLLRCTYIKANAGRCTYQFCHKSLQRLYKQDAEQIIKAGRNILGVDVNQHVGADQANYLWKCPKCRGNCQCSRCRKAAGLVPLGGFRSGDGGNVEGAVLPATSKRSSPAETAPQLKKSKKDPPLSKFSAQDRLQLDKVVRGLGKKVAEKQQGESSSSASRPAQSMQQQKFQRPLQAPARRVEAPTLATIETRLPVANLKERMWLYESLVRFDVFGIPKAILSRLDRFDDWTEGQLQALLEKLICIVAEVNTVKSTPAKNKHKRLIEAFRLSGHDLSRGETWVAARVFCQSEQMAVPELANVHPLPHQMGDCKQVRRVAPAEPVETLLSARHTRSRRGAETRASERMKALAKKELADSEEESSSGEEQEDDAEQYDEEEEEEEAPRGSRRRVERQVGTRRSARQRGMDAEQDSDASDGEEQEQESDDDDEDDGDGSSSSDQDSDSDSSEEGDGEEDEQEEKGDVSKDTTDNEAETPSAPEGPVVMPPFEERVAILSGLVNSLVQSKQVTDELSASVKMTQAITKAGKEEWRELGLEHVDELQAVNAKAPSMALVQEYAAWKEERRKLEAQHIAALRDCRVNTHLQLDACKIRTGPLGVDTDGNEYWQLSEYVEKMPQETQGRWAWSLLVLGSTFYQAPQARAAEEERDAMQLDEEDNASEEVRSNKSRGPPYVIIDVPGKDTRRARERAAPEKESAAEGEDVSFNTPPPTRSPLAEPTRDGSEAGDVKVVGFSGTNNPEAILRLSIYVLNRLVWLEYEEAVAERKGEESGEIGMLYSTASARTADSADKGEGSTSMLNTTGTHPPTPQTAKERRSRKAEFKEMQASRRRNVEALSEKLRMLRDYYAWHTDEVEA